MRAPIGQVWKGGYAGRHAVWAAAAILWVGAMAAGVGALLLHQASAGQGVIGAVNQDALAGAGLELGGGKPTAVMLVHPECPCSLASVAQLEVLMTRCDGRLNGVVVVEDLPGFPAKASKIWQAAVRIPGVRCVEDKGSEIVRRVGARTSGQVLVFDGQGQVGFRGGITQSRGHQGDNDGMDAIEALVRKGRASVASTPVFGCSLVAEGEGR